jgi:hypothetical protein
MQNFNDIISLYYVKQEDVKAEVTAEIASKAFPAADPDDKAAGGPYFADRTTDKERAGR